MRPACLLVSLGLILASCGSNVGGSPAVSSSSSPPHPFANSTVLCFDGTSLVNPSAGDPCSTHGRLAAWVAPHISVVCEDGTAFYAVVLHNPCATHRGIDQDAGPGPVITEIGTSAICRDGRPTYAGDVSAGCAQQGGVAAVVAPRTAVCKDGSQVQAVDVRSACTGRGGLQSVGLRDFQQCNDMNLVYADGSAARSACDAHSGLWRGVVPPGVVCQDWRWLPVEMWANFDDYCQKHGGTLARVSGASALCEDGTVGFGGGFDRCQGHGRTLRIY
jgi:hypothetical protein